MKTRQFVVAVFTLTLAFAPQSFRTSTAASLQARYGARLISPRAGDVLVPGQQVRIEWESILPSMDLSWCEVEIFLSLDGGITNARRITPELDPRIKYFDWTVPNTPTATAVLDIHFGCQGYFPESASVQAQSAFVIRPAR